MITVSCKTESEVSPVVSLVEDPVFSSQSTQSVTLFGDMEFDRLTDEGAYNEFIINADTSRQNQTITNSTPEICEIEGNRISRLQNAIGVVKFSLPSGFSKEFRLDFRSQPTSLYVWTGHSGGVAGSVFASLNSAMDVQKDLNYFVSFSPTSSPTKNANCWLSSVDLTCVPIATNIFGTWTTANSGCLISPRHYIGVKHWLDGSSSNMGAGKKLRLAGSDGSIHERTVLARVESEFYADLILCTLDQDIPESVSFAKIPGNWIESVLTIDGIKRPRIQATGFWIDQFKRGFVAGYDLYYGGPNNTGVSNYNNNGTIVYDVVRTVFWDTSFDSASYDSHALHGKEKFISSPVTGDSGSPFFILSDGEAVLVALASYSIAGAFFYEKAAFALNDMISRADAAAGVSTGYTVTVAPDPTA